MALSRRSFLAGASALAAAASIDPAAHAQGSDNSSSRPNILIFMPDQTNGSTVLEGSGCIHPNLDRFRAEAVTFNSAYCPTPHCCPSRASFQTGVYPSEHGVFNNVNTDTAIHANPYPGTRFFSTALGDAGYNLAYSGKWHVARNITPEDVGWKNLSHREQGAYHAGKMRERTTWEPAIAEDEAPSGRKPGEILRPDWGNLQFYRTLPNRGATGYEGLPDAEVVRTGIEGMQRLARKSQPWCVMISNNGGHDRYHAPGKFVDMYREKNIQLPSSFSDLMNDKSRIYQRMRYQYWSQMSKDEYKQTLLHYWAMLSMQDALFGEILQGLEQTGQADNTIVLFVSDHGDYGGAHGLWMKGIPAFQEAYHIPWIMRWPKRVKQPGRQVDAFVSTVDFAPTILEAAGAQTDMPLAGRSLLPWLRAEKPAKWRTAVYSQVNGFELYYTQRSVMSKRYKYVYNGFDYDELYDLKADPGETHNLAFPNLPQTGARVSRALGLPPDGSVPWPQLPGNLEEARKQLLTGMWKFAAKHRDQIFNSYGTVAMAPYGPGLAFKDNGATSS